MKDKNSIKIKQRLRRRQHTRKYLAGTAERPRLAVYRSLNSIYAQIIDDNQGTTLVSASNLSPEFKAKYPATDAPLKNKDLSGKVGLLLAELAKSKGITKVCFDRSGYLYHGRVKALADGARKGGLQF
jgi:large subunit ribosomal protein L18